MLKDNLIASSSPESVSILLVSPNKADESLLRNILHHCGWQIYFCPSASEASSHLRSAPADMILCDRDLPDGTWKDVLASADSALSPPVVVFSHYADESLWGEVLKLGGYDVLVKPFDRSEVTRVVGMARRRHVQSVASGLSSLALAMDRYSPTESQRHPLVQNSPSQPVLPGSTRSNTGSPKLHGNESVAVRSAACAI